MAFFYNNRYDPFGQMFGSMMFDRPQPIRSLNDFYYHPRQYYRDPYYYDNDSEDEQEEDIVYYQPPSPRHYRKPTCQSYPKKKHHSRTHIQVPIETTQYYEIKSPPVASNTVDTPYLDTQKRNQAASVIQRAYRIHAEQRKSKAVAVISTAYLNYKAKIETRHNVIQPLKQLESLKEAINELVEVFVGRRKVMTRSIQFENGTANIKHCKNRDLLEYEDKLIKIMLKADAICSGGNDFVRASRKSLIGNIQNLLDSIDTHKLMERERRQRELEESDCDALSCSSMETDNDDF